MKYIITENIFKRLIDKLRGGMNKEESERRIKKLMNKYVTNHLFYSLKEGEPVGGYLRTWYIGGNPVLGLTGYDIFNINNDLIDDFKNTFDLNDVEAKKILIDKFKEKFIN